MALKVEREQAAPAALDLGSTPVLGQVVRLDRDRVEVELSDPAAATTVTVSDLVALEAETGFLMGLVEAVTGPGSGDSSAHEGSAGASPAELRIMPIGTFARSEDGGRTFRRAATAYPHIGQNCHLVDGETLRRFMSILSDEVAPAERLVLGRYVADRDSPAVADANRLFQRHLALLGNTGAGKSWAVARMLEQAAQLGHANLIVFDLHGEYATLAHGANGAKPVARRLRMAGPADLGRAHDDVLYLPYWLLTRDELMTLVLNPDDRYASDHLFRFTEHVQMLKQVSLVETAPGDERTQPVSTFTVDAPIPYRLSHLVRLLRNDDTEKIPQPPSTRLEQGPFFGRLSGFISRLEARATDPRYGFIFSPPDSTLSYAWLVETATKLLEAGPGSIGIKVVDLSEVPSAAAPLVAGVLARLVYDVQFWMPPARRTPVCLVCDEAHLYLPPAEKAGAAHRAALQAFEAIAKEGRKYGVALLVVSQRPTDVNATILSQCNNFLVMRLTNDHDRAMIERLIPEALSGVAGVLPALEPGEAVVIGDALLLPTRVKLDPPSHPPASATQRYWSLWTEQPSSQEAIAAGVEALRNQLRSVH